MISTKRSCDKLEGHGLHKGRLKEHLVTTNHPRSLISTGGIWKLHGDRSLQAQGKRGFCPCTTWISGCCRCCLEKYVICTDIYMFISFVILCIVMWFSDILWQSQRCSSVFVVANICKYGQIDIQSYNQYGRLGVDPSDGGSLDGSSTGTPWNQITISDKIK